MNRLLIPFLKNIFASKSDQPLKSYHSSWRRVQDWKFKLSEMLKQWAFPLIHIPIYSFKFDLPLLLDHVILFGILRLDLGITSRIEDFLFHQWAPLPSTRAESISLWYSQSSYSLIEIIIVSGYHIQEIGPWRWRLKTMYAPCCSRGADMLLLPRELVGWVGVVSIYCIVLKLIWRGF